MKKKRKKKNKPELLFGYAIREGKCCNGLKTDNNFCFCLVLTNSPSKKKVFCLLIKQLWFDLSN